MKCKAYKDFHIDTYALYGNDCVVYGPYYRKSDGRRIVTLKIGERLYTQLYARVKLEIKLGRRLVEGETVDHKDDDKMNDKFGNLQLLSLGKNSAKANEGKACRNLRTSEEYRQMQRRGSKSRQKKQLAKDADMKARSIDASRVRYLEFGWKKRLARELGLTKRSVDGLLKRNPSLYKRLRWDG